MKFAKKLLFPIALSCLLASSAFAAFEKTNTYAQDTFNDVPQNAWYASEVKSSYELGLFGGKGDGIFDPSGKVTVAEAVTLASRACSIYAGETIPEKAGGKWYDMYVEYAKSKNFLEDGQFDNFDRPAKRYEVASLFAKAMPDGYYNAKNNVTEIPDVFSDSAYADDILMLYKAGIVMGSDSYGNFRPEDNITRAECAAIINRVALPSGRVEGTLDKYSDDDAYLLVYNISMNGYKEGINSGWVLDNRGAVPKTSLESGYDSLTDISTTDGAAMIREFNKITTGKINAEINISVTPKKFDGVSLEFRNDKDEPVYKIVTEDGAWKYVNADGTKTVLLEKANEVQDFLFRITVDLDNNKAETVINEKSCGEASLITTGDNTNILNFRFATDKEHTPAITMGRVKMYANYGVNDDFDINENGVAPYGWTGKGVAKNGILTVTKGEAYKSFSPLSGTVIANTQFNLTKNQSICFALKSGTKDIVKVTSDDKSFYANGEKIYDYVKNLWYRVRIEADTKTNKAIIHINGRNIATVDFADKTTSVDNLVLANASSDEVAFDDVNVFVKQHHDDYVPVPVVPQGTDDYYVGINICSLWVNGTHYGWSCISAFEDHIPVLGLYDEGNPESADWEIKYFIEHGIDFQAFCWYPDNGDAPIKTPDYGAQLYDGFMFAEYSDMTNYCILWEARNSKRPTSVKSFKEYFAPYLIEHFIKDPRYMVIDNMPILSVYGQDFLAQSLGGNDKVKECLDYLEAEVKKLGFDGMIFDCCGSASADYEAMGFDSCHAYGWGNGGYSLDINKTNINKSAAYKGVYTIPTISVGFNSIPWHDIKYPLMTVEDYKKAHEWVKNEYLPANATKGTWQEKTVWLSTWNEYGEGTYIMPSEEHVGFGYIDVIREAYTSEKIDESLNTVPNAAQKERINHLFPQYRKLLRKQGTYAEKATDEELVSLYTIDYTKSDRLNVSHTNKFEFTEEGLVGTVIGDTHIIANSIDLDTEDISHIRVTLDVPAGTWVQLYFITNQSPNWNADKQTGFNPEKGTMASYLIEMTTVKNWAGRVTGFRIDPGQSAAGVEGNQFKIKSIEFMTKPDRASKKMTVNGETFNMQFPYQQGKNGDLLFAFDPEFALDFRLGCFHTWDADKKQLTLQMNGKTLVYTIGKDTYTLNGSEKKLPEAITMLDGLPLLPIKQLCEDAGFKYSVNEEGFAVIETHEKAYFDMIAARTKGHWNFDVDGDTEKWASTFMNLSAWDGALIATSNSDHKDPTINLSTKAGIKAANYVAVEVRCRYKYEADKNHPWVLYFTTDRDNKMNEAKSVRAYLKSTDSKGEWETYRVDLTNVETWRNTIADLRFDPFNAVGTMEIDYIRFIEGENEAAMQVAPNGMKIFNADAEGKLFQFFSDNAKISIVDDPDRAGNKCYLVGANGDKKNWYYIRQLVEYTPGATYKVCYDLKIASHGTNTNLDDSFGTNITYNARYGGSEEASVDHVGMTQTKHVKVGDGWVRAEITFTVSEKSDIRHEDQFAVYANPVNDIGVAFYIDNIVIEEVKE